MRLEICQSRSSFSTRLNDLVQIENFILKNSHPLQLMSFSRSISIEEVYQIFRNPLIKIPTVRESLSFSGCFKEDNYKMVLWEEGMKIGEHLMLFSKSKIKRIPCPPIFDITYEFIFKTPRVLGVLLPHSLNNISKHMRI